MASTLHEPLKRGASVLLQLGETLHHARTEYQEVLIAETEAYGRALFLDGSIQSAEADEALYHEPFVHPALVLHGAPRRVLVAGAGEGATAREVLRHPSVESVLTVDLDDQVVEACKEHLPRWHQGSFEDPRVELRYEDVQDTLEAARPGFFDAIFLDVTDPMENGPAVDLFTVKFFRKVARALADDGIMVIQAGELEPREVQTTTAVRSTLAAVFPWVTLGHSYIPSFHGLWGFALAAKRSFDTEPADLRDRIARLPTNALRVYDEHRHRAFLHLPRFLAAMATAPGRVVTGEDDERLVAPR